MMTSSSDKPSPILRLDKVVKAYQKQIAVNEVSFEVPQGTIFGLLGPNGAGKTSLIRIITTITAADSGTVWLRGEPLNNDHPNWIGYMPEERGLYKKMKVGENLLYLARLKGLSYSEAEKRIRLWLERFGALEWWSKKVDDLSKGMQQKIQFIATVVHEPSLIILDEPFTGLDPVNTNLLKDEIRRLRDRGTTILFSTHRMEQVEEICERIILINKGRVVLQGKVADIKNDFKDHVFHIDYEGTLPSDIDRFADLVESSHHHIRLRLVAGTHSDDLLRHLLAHGVHIVAFREVLPSINEIFIKIVGNE